MEVFIDLYIFTAILKFLTHVEYLRNRGVSEKTLAFQVKNIILYHINRNTLYACPYCDLCNYDILFLWGKISHEISNTQT